MLDLAGHAKVWAEPAAGCLLPAARRVLERVGEGARLGLVLCGGNATTSDVLRRAADFGLRCSTLNSPGLFRCLLARKKQMKRESL